MPGLFRSEAAVGAVCLALAGAASHSGAADPQRSGEAIYRELCASCHGDNGEGVAGEYDEPLYGNRSLDSLARLIHRTMPEDEEEKCVDEDAQAVAAYIFDAFYSPQARTRLQPPKVAFARLTNGQFRNSIADLVGGFREPFDAGSERGLAARYWNKKEEEKPERSFERIDPAIDFDFGGDSPDPEQLDAESFNVSWKGSILAPTTGDYRFRLRTRNGVRLWINAPDRGGDRRRDREPALIDGWVSSGNEERELEEGIFLLGGRAYPLRLEFFKFKEPLANIALEWRPPHGRWSPIPADALAPREAPPVSVVAADLPPDDGSLGYERGTTVSKEWHEATTAVAIEVASDVASQVDRLAGIEDGAPDRDDRIRAFCREFAARAFRRPLNAEEEERFVDRHFAEGIETESAVKRVVVLVLKSPRFLFPEAGIGGSGQHEVAARLALGLWDSLPDAVLRDAAAHGDLGSREQVVEQAQRMAQDGRARTKVREFFAHWLAMDEAEDLSKDTDAYPGFDEELVADLRASLETFVDHVVWSDESDYRELLLADYLFMNRRLAQFYRTPAVEGAGFERIALDGNERAGIITHPLLLSAFSYHRSSSPIHRGVFLTRNVLGRFLKPPPMAIEFMDDRFDPHLTMREKVTQLTGKESCMACHATINPLGFSLEFYDAVGRFRTQENDQPINAVSEYTTPDGDVITLTGARDVARHAVDSREAQIGFVRQLFHHVAKQPPAAYGLDTLDSLHERFVDGGFSIRELLVAVAAVPALASHDAGEAAQETTAATPPEPDTPSQP